MKTPLEMAQLRFRIAIQQALSAGVGSAQLQTILSEECVNEVDYAKDDSAGKDSTLDYTQGDSLCGR